MVKEKNKPDFLKDIDTAIMDELTKGGLSDNAAGLAGEVTELVEVANICGFPFNGYLGKIETPRPSGVMDEVVIAFTESEADRGKTGDGLHLENYFKIGSRLLVSGKVQTLKDFESGKVLVFILADYVALSPKAMLQDDVAIRGELAYEPTYRETPRGKRIADIMLKVKNELTGGYCFIPCICWQEQADEAATWQRGDTVELLGRYQSREYQKGIAGEMVEWEIRTAYEVSVRQIERKGVAHNAE